MSRKMDSRYRSGYPDINKFWKEKKELIEKHLIEKYRSKAINRFKWNFSEELDIPDWEPERTLYDTGMCTIFRLDGTEKIFCLPIMQNEIDLDSYGRIVGWKAYSRGTDKIREIILQQQLNKDNAVLIYDNVAKINAKEHVYLIIQEILNLMQTIRLNVNAQKNIWMFKTNENESLDDINTFFEFMENIPAVFKTKNGLDNAEVMNLPIPYIANELRKTLVEYDGDILQFLGINNVPIEKNERVNIPETESNKHELTIDLKNFITTRDRAVKDAKRILGIDISYEKVMPEIKVDNMSNKKDETVKKNKEVKE